MKKILSVLLVGVFAFGVAACESEESQSTSPSGNQIVWN